MRVLYSPSSHIKLHYNSTTSTLGDIAHEFEQFRRPLLRLPPKAHPTGLAYPFEGHLVDEEFVELTSSIQGALNHTLEVAFGSRDNIDNSPLEFESHGPNLVAVVDVLTHAIHEINSGRAPEVFDHYDNLQPIFSQFLFQLMNYTCQNAPFDRYNNVSSPLEYWKKLSRHSDAQILAYLAIKLFSIVPNSMAEEQTVSRFTKLNSPKRGRQKSSTIIHMTQIKQHEQRLMKDKETLPPPTPPTMRFRGLSDYVGGLGCPTPVTEDLPEVSDTSISQGPASDGNGVDTWEVKAGFDEEVECPTEGSRAGCEVVEAEHVNLSEPLLLDLLGEIPVAGANLPFPPDRAYNAPSMSGGEKQPLVAEAFTF